MPRTIASEAQPPDKKLSAWKGRAFPHGERQSRKSKGNGKGLDQNTQLIQTMHEPPPYTDAHIAAYPVEYIAGIDLYNAGEFHAAHDAWEDRWMGEVGQQEKLFLQAMIQSAVAFHHLEIGRPGAARQMHERAKEKFARLGTSVFMSLDLIDYQAQLDRALSWLWTVADPRELTPPSFQIPRITLLPEINEYD